MDENLGLRVAAASGLLEVAAYNAILDYVSPVPVFASGAQAAEHGLAHIDTPRADAVKVIQRLARKPGFVNEASNEGSNT